MARRRIKRLKQQSEIWLHFRFYKDRLLIWYASKAPVFACILKFIAYLILLYAISLTSIYQAILSKSMVLDAQFAGFILRGLGEQSHVSGPALWLGKDCIITVLPACTALEFSWFLIAAILAFPAKWGQRFLGVITGVSVTLFLNVVRVVSLYVVGVHWTAFLTVVHEEVWGIVLNISTFVLMVGWIMWARRSPELNSHVPA